MRTNASKYIIYLAGLVGSLVASQAVAGTITGSAHDFSSQGWNAAEEICIACHTPHNADTTVSQAPLWNHEITNATFSLYASTSIDGAISAQPGELSLLCLSCHDGTVAIDSYGGASGGSFLTAHATQNLGTSLTNDHPISLTYTTSTAAVDGGLHDPAATNVTIGDVAGRFSTGSIDTVMLSNGTVQCSSCHDVHNTFTVPGAQGGSPMLKVSKNNSALCLTCHAK